MADKLMLCLVGPHAGQLITMDDATALTAVSDGWAEEVPGLPYSNENVQRSVPMWEWPKSLVNWLGDEWYNMEPKPPAPQPEPQPIATSLSPNTAVLGGSDVTMHVMGSGFTATSVIYFADQPEPIVFVSANDISTVVKPSLGWGAVTVDVYVQSSDGKKSSTLPFTFTDAGRASK